MNEGVRRNESLLAAVMRGPEAKADEAEKSPPPADKSGLFTAVKAVRSRAIDAGVAETMEAAKAMSETTRAQYGRINKRRLAGRVPDLAGVSRASWYPTVAALKAGLASRVQVAMREQDKAQRGGDIETAMRMVEVAAQALDQLEALKAATPPPPVKVQRSARQRLPKSPTWQARVYEAATEAMRPAIAVMWATGARPAELEQGVDLKRVQGGFQVRIPGAKVNDAKKAGQPVRVLLVKGNTAAGKALAAALGDADSMTVQRKAARIGKDFSDHIRPRLPASYAVSAYSFRHQAAANMKAELKDAAKVARAMGHRSTRSQQRYGTARQSQSGGGAVVDARATHQPAERRGMVQSPPVRGPDGPGLG